MDNVQGGGGVLVNVQEWGYFSFFLRADDVTQTMSKGGGGACECLDPPPPLSGNPVSAPARLALSWPAHRATNLDGETKFAPHLSGFPLPNAKFGYVGEFDAT